MERSEPYHSHRFRNDPDDERFPNYTRTGIATIRIFHPQRLRCRFNMASHRSIAETAPLQRRSPVSCSVDQHGALQQGGFLCHLQRVRCGPPFPFVLIHSPVQTPHLPQTQTLIKTPDPIPLIILQSPLFRLELCVATTKDGERKVERSAER